MRGSARIAALAACALVAVPATADAATLNVTTTADELNGGSDGGCSLREAISSVNNGANFTPDCTAVTSPNPYGTSDRINLPSGTYTLTINGAGEDNNGTGDLDIKNNLIIIGDGNPTITQSFATDDRNIHVPVTTASVTLDSVTVSGGEATGAVAQGGNILFSGSSSTTLALNNTTISGGLANNAGGQGGGVSAPFGGNVVVQAGSVIEDNVAGGTGTGQGGGIHMGGGTGSLTVSDSEISSNDANLNSTTLSAGRGGGISFVSNGPANLDLNNATIDGNHAAGGSGQGSGTGGAIYVLTSGPITLTADGGAISNNIAGGGTGWNAGNQSAGFGGGLYFASGGGTASATLTDVNVIGNKAGGDGDRGNGSGGGILTDSDLNVLGSTISGNLAGSDPATTGAPDLIGNGGGIRAEFMADADVTVTSSTVTNNRAGDNVGTGGGISSSAAGNLVVTDSTVSGNQAGEATAGGGATGGGIFRFSNSGSPVDTITRTAVFGNSTTGAGTDTAQGAGMYAATVGSLSIDSSTISGNTATGDNGDPAGGGIVFDSPAMGAGTYLVDNSTISGNTATSALDQGGNGGGLAVGISLAANSPEVTLRHVTLADNVASPDTNGAADDGRGGNIFIGPYSTTDKLHLRASIITGGSSGSAGTANCALETAGGIDSLGENIESTSPTQCDLNGSGDQIGVNPLIGPLALNTPGTTQTRALQAGSPAIDSVPAAGCPNLDQRGLTRPQGSACDAGAYEVFQAVIPIADPPSQPVVQTPTTPKTKCPKGKKPKKVKGKTKCVKKKRKKKK